MKTSRSTKRSLVTDGSVRRVSASRAPSQRTAGRLESPQQAAPVVDENVVLSPNCWMLLEYDSIQEVEKIESMLESPSGGYIEQTWLYIDPISARDWLRVAGDAMYRRLFTFSSYGGSKLAEVAELVSHFYKEYHPSDALDVIALGSGDAEKECELTQHLLPNFKFLRLLLLDISQALLTTALKSANTMFNSQPNVDLFSIVGDFFQLQRYLSLFSPPSTKRRRLVTMLGHTFINLENEIKFVRQTLGCLDPGDLFLLDFTVAAAPADQENEILKKDSRFQSGPFSNIDKAYEEFFTRALERFCRGFIGATFSSVLDNATSRVPGSYTIERRARVRAVGKPDRDFTVYLHKRYDPSLLAQSLRKEGWKLLKMWPFGEHGDRRVALFQRLAPGASNSTGSA